MIKSRLLTFCTYLFVLNITAWANAQSDSLAFARAFKTLEEARYCYTVSAQSEVCSEILDRAYQLSGRHAYFLEQIISYLFSIGQYVEARNYILIKRVDTLSNSLQARHAHFKGILELRSGFEYFYEAFHSFKKAYTLELRSPYPSNKFLSQVQNAMGYTKMIYGGPNMQDDLDYPHTNWITPDLVDALRNFEQAIYFDKENSFAIANRDTLLAKIEDSGKDIQQILLRIKPKPLKTIKKEFSIFEKSENDTLDKVNINYLPNNKHILLQVLQQYDELLIVSDISGSMKDIHTKKGVSRFRLMRELNLFLFHELRASTKVGMVTVGRGCNDMPELFFPTSLNARKDIMDRFKAIGPLGSTPLSYSISLSKQLYTITKDTPKAMFLISDGMETCGNPLDLCMLAGDLHAMGIDIHIISFIVEGMEDSEYAYEIYNCMAQYSNGRIFKYDEDVVEEEKPDPEPFFEESLLLPPIEYGENFQKPILHFVVDLTKYFSEEKKK